MSLLFWRKTKETGIYRPDYQPQTSDVHITETNPLPVKPVLTDEDDPLRTEITNNVLPPVAGQTIKYTVNVPGIGAASAYAAGDAFGTLITLHGVFRAEKGSGTLVGIVFHDLDDEGSQVDVHFFSEAVTTSADNAAFGPTDAENLLELGAVSIVDFFNLGSNQVGVLRNLSMALVSNKPDLYVRLVTQGTPNITAGQEPWIAFYIVPD